MRRPMLIIAGLVCALGVAYAEAPVIRGLCPREGAVGDKVYVLGQYFSETCADNIVKFGETVAEVGSCSPRHLVVTVPAGLAEGETAVTVTVADATSEAVKFTVIVPGVPEITELKPVTGAVGTPVCITGTNLGRFGQRVTVKFGDVETHGVAWMKSIYTRVPAGVTGEVAVKVVVHAVESNSLPFTVTEAPLPVITSIAPEKGAPGDLVKIKGENFVRRGGFFWGTRTDENKVKVLFGQTEAKVLFACRDVVMAVVPVMDAGPVGVSVAVGERVSAETVPFEVLAAAVPVVTELAPTEGTVGTLVRIKGTDLGGYRAVIEVSFNGTAATKVSASWDGTKVSAVVPVGATTGPVTVKVNGAEAVEKPVFTVTELPAPVIESLDPASGPVGARVVIKGSNLATAYLKPEVTFGDVKARVGGCYSWSPLPDGTTPGSMIVAIVPEGLAVGVVQVKVTLAGVASNAVDFEVTEAPAEPPDGGEHHDGTHRP